MKVPDVSLRMPDGLRRLGVTLAVSLALLVSIAPGQAHAITRSEVVSRAKSWVRKKVGYSQSRMYGGYRRDCSGFVSMAWKLRGSYTTRTIARTAKAVSIRRLKPGDAILEPGHVQIFERWQSQRKGLYVALEESTNGRPALRRVKRIPRRAIALRYRGITQPLPLPAQDPSATPAPSPLPSPSTTPAPSPVPGSVGATPTPIVWPIQAPLSVIQA